MWLHIILETKHSGTFISIKYDPEAQCFERFKTFLKTYLTPYKITVVCRKFIRDFEFI